MLQRLREFARRLSDGAEAAVRSERHLRQIVQLQLLDSVINTPRFHEPRRLLSSGYKVFSQGYEDGMIAEVFRRIGVTSRRFIEIGVENGMECNTAYLLVQGWTGIWIEASHQGAADARSLFRNYEVQVIDDRVTAENVDDLVNRLAGADELDLLSIDIDFNDYWIWRALNSVRPRLVVIEYNATFSPALRKTIPYNPSLVWNGSNYFGATLGALEALAQDKQYSLVGCSPAGVNAFFVRNDLIADHFCSPFTAVNHYEPPRYGLAGPSGHPPGIGPWVDV